MLKLWVGTQIGENQLNIKTTTYGVIFWIPFNISHIHFDVEISNPATSYTQCGLCEFNSTLPTIITTGSGRGKFVNVTKNGHVDFDTSGVAGCFFIGKCSKTSSDDYSDIFVRNIYCE